MKRFFCYLILITCVMLLIVIRWYGSNLVDWMCRIVRMRAPVLHGTIDMQNQVVVFNHPSTFLEHLVLYRVFQPHKGITGLAGAIFFHYVFLSHLHFLFVSKEGGENTLRRIQRHLQVHPETFVIAAYTLHKNYEYSGTMRGVGMPSRIQSMPFRIDDSIQPVVIIYEGLDMLQNNQSYEWARILSGKNDWITPHVFLLPTLYRKDYPTIEAYMEATRTTMDVVLRRESMRLCTI